MYINNLTPLSISFSEREILPFFVNLRMEHFLSFESYSHCDWTAPNLRHENLITTLSPPLSSNTLYILQSQSVPFFGLHNNEPEIPIPFCIGF